VPYGWLRIICPIESVRKNQLSKTSTTNFGALCWSSPFSAMTTDLYPWHLSDTFDRQAPPDRWSDKEAIEAIDAIGDR